MRALCAIVAVAAACTTAQPSISIDVVESPRFVAYYVAPGDCTCVTDVGFPAQGACASRTTASQSCSCYPAACITHVSLLEAGATIADADKAMPQMYGTLGGDLTANAMAFEGCGDDATVVLSTTFPDAVQVTLQSGTVTWPAMTSDEFLITTNNDLGTKTCRAAPDVTSQPVGSSANVAVGVLRGPVVSASANVAFRLWTTN